MYGVGSGLNSRPWEGEGRCWGSCSRWTSWSDWLHSPSLPEPFSSSLDCGTIPVDAVVCPLNMNCNAVLGISSSHCLSVLTQSDFQCPLCFTHIRSMWPKRPAISCLIDWFCYLFAHQDQFASYHNVAMSLYDIINYVSVAWEILRILPGYFAYTDHSVSKS